MGVILTILVVLLIVGAWMFIVPATAAAGFFVAGVLAAISSFGGIIRGVADTFTTDSDRMFRLYYDDKEPAKVSWFFGPCFSGFPLIIRHTIAMTKHQFDVYWGKLSGFASANLLTALFFWPILIVFTAVHWAVSAIYGFIWAVLFEALFLIFMLIFYVLFGLFWVIDRLTLHARKLSNHCPHCNENSLIPEFVCPYCGKIHKKLSPNRYGVFNHQCECGCVLGATYFTGKSRLHAICPHCGEPFKTAATRPLTLQLVGGTSSGKTVYLASLFHAINDKASLNGLELTPDPVCRDGLQELNSFVAGKGDPAATQGRDVTFYAEVANMGKGKTPVKLEIVDIPGEMFAGETALQEGLHKMSQYNYADGFLFLVDPFSDGDLLNSQPNDGTNVSPIAATEVFHNFDGYLIAQKFAKTGQLIDKPLSVIVVKADTEAVANEISNQMIKEAAEASPQQSYDQVRDDMIKQYLTSIGQSDLVSNIEARFKNAHFYLASAMGHAPNAGGAYEPDGVLEPAEAIFRTANKDFHARLMGRK